MSNNILSEEIVLLIVNIAIVYPQQWGELHGRWEDLLSCDALIRLILFLSGTYVGSMTSNLLLFKKITKKLGEFSTIQYFFVF